MTRQPFAWDRAMAFGLGVLKLPPAAFWAMTPRELDAALEGHYGRQRRTGAPSRGDLATLTKAYPDHPPTETMVHDQQHPYRDL